MSEKKPLTQLSTFRGIRVDPTLATKDMNLNNPSTIKGVGNDAAVLRLQGQKSSGEHGYADRRGTLRPQPMPR